LTDYRTYPIRDEVLLDLLIVTFVDGKPMRVDGRNRREACREAGLEARSQGGANARFLA
jgi:hypothetical protein